VSRDHTSAWTHARPTAIDLRAHHVSVLPAKPRPAANRSALSPLARQAVTRRFQIVRVSDIVGQTVGDQCVRRYDGVAAPVTVSVITIDRFRRSRWTGFGDRDRVNFAVKVKNRPPATGWAPGSR
jgi:hypothetical protein